jgi:hypothetical protein
VLVEPEVVGMTVLVGALRIAEQALTFAEWQTVGAELLVDSSGLVGQIGEGCEEQVTVSANGIVLGDLECMRFAHGEVEVSAQA